MGVLDNVMPGVAATVLGALGTTGTLRRQKTTLDARSGDRVDNGATYYPVVCSGPKAYALQQVNGTTILQGDVKVDVAAKGLPVKPDAGTDTLDVAGETFKVVNAVGRYAGAAVVVWEVQARK